MKISFAFIACLFCALIAKGQPDYSLKLNNLAQLTMPEKPRQVPAAGGMVYTALKDSCLYFAQTYPVESVFAMDKMSEAWQKEIYQSYIDGLLESAPGTLVDIRPKLVAGSLYGNEFEYQVKGINSYPMRYQRVVFINNTLISYGIWCGNSQAINHKADADRFYSSFRLLPQAKQPGKSFMAGISASKIIYIAAGFGGILLLIIVVAYFYKKSSR